MQPRTRRVVIAASAGLVVVALGAGALWASARGADPAPAGTASPTPSATATTPSASPAPSTTPGGVQDAPGTGPAPDAGPPGSGAGAPTSPAAPAAPGAPAMVDVVVTFAGWNSLSSAVEVGAYVPVVETPGACTLVLDGPAGTLTRQVAGTADASTVSCVVTVPDSEVSAGTWRATMSYASVTSSGTGAATEVVVP